MADFFSSIFGSKPKVPGLPRIDFNQEQQNTITGNLQALPSAQNLASATNTFNQSELDRIYEEALPGYNRIKSNLGEQYSALTAGQIPQDVQDAVLRNAAVRAFQGGFAGSGMQRNLSARDLGLTSLDLIGRGQDATQRWLSTAAAPRFDVTSMFLTPAQRIPMVVNERDNQWNAQWLKNQVSAMPDPKARGIHDGVVNLLMGIGNEYGGNWQTSSPDTWGRTNSTPQGGVGGGGTSSPFYTPQPQGQGANQYGYQNFGGYQGWSGYSEPPAGTGYDPGRDVSFDASTYGGF